MVAVTDEMIPIQTPLAFFREENRIEYPPVGRPPENRNRPLLSKVKDAELIDRKVRRIDDDGRIQRVITSHPTDRFQRLADELAPFLRRPRVQESAQCLAARIDAALKHGGIF